MPTRQGKLSNDALSRYLEISHAQVSRMRSGSRHPSVTTIGTLEKILHWPAEDQIRLILNDKTYTQDGQEVPLGKYGRTLDAILREWAPDDPEAAVRKVNATSYSGPVSFRNVTPVFSSEQ